VACVGAEQLGKYQAISGHDAGEGMDVHVSTNSIQTLQIALCQTDILTIFLLDISHACDFHNHDMT
jgi:hypothetical protein